MFGNQIHRSVCAIATMAALWSIPVLSEAAELHRLVVVGFPAKNVAMKYPTPEYPRNALNLHISGNVLLRVQVENGVIVEAKTISHSSPVLAYSAQHWVTHQWKFKPAVTGAFTIPISYKESA
jgi:outer membrane biosynthesis protein TonB